MSQQSGVLFRPWLWLPSRLAHDSAPYILPPFSALTGSADKTYRPFEWRGLRFENPLGLAGGVDKSGRCLKAWNKLGAGFLEVGTITPEPQGPNPGKIMDRDVARAALWNKMGFPNPGLKVLAKQLQSFDRQGTPLFINIGKNRWTDNAQAFQDYALCIKELHTLADVFVVNVSSPNTKGLRDLLSEKELKSFLENIKKQVEPVCPDKPLILKLSPDMDEQTLQMALTHSAEFVDGWILTNTTKSRYEGHPFSADTGGVSGVPLQELSRKALAVARAFKEKFPEKLLISVGGVNSSQEVKRRLDGGADLVQMYSALVFQGPLFFRRTLKQLRVTE
jgi:dihydroorotate dehydrogenase